ncbi:uracil-DNA glycosylase family protein [Aestuariibacter halophilus]|uniref:Uracil-DNA glycosylase family protein n=1 Tax=Fluctibacter halophilus TaxID=226011 RepID=A0ABS8GDQ6_9ALTE|nr:uracil-DNA glycosylase family protein [Aestuariibacter halophilus]MCC2618246.1 uracil-DNA glycosylase family protein [Aestuariibacter halophilus]
MTNTIPDEIKRCQLCAQFLPCPPRPVLQYLPTARIVIVGQAPGKRAHDSNTPWNDPSGDRLRDWLQLSREVFYDARQVALVPMAFCYPGRGKSGDLPPSTTCAPTWHAALMAALRDPLVLLVGQYAQGYYLQDKRTLTERVKHWQDYQGQGLVLPHPSPRNNIWLRRHPWFEQQVLPQYRQKVAAALTQG